MFISLPYSLFIFPLVLVVAARPVGSAATELRELTASNFSSSTKHGVWFVEYFSPYCQHCRAFAPTWKELVEHVESQSIGISLAQVDCVSQGDLCDDNKIKGYPTMKLYEDGKELETFPHARELDILKKYVTDHAHKSSEPDPDPSPIPSPGPSPNPHGAVLPLDKKTFSDTIAEGPMFVKFFAPWCGHCRKLAPTWVQFAARMKGKVTVAEVNCEEHKGLCSQQNIQGYPMIFFYQHGHTLDYTGRRTLEAMETFADAALAPPLKSISSSELTPILEEQEVFYLLIHEGLDSALQDRIEEASQPLHGSPQIYSIRSSSKLLKSLSLQETQQLPVLVSLKDHSSVFFRKLALAPNTRIEPMSDWLLAHSLPTSTELNADNFKHVMGSSPVPQGTPSRLVVLAAVDPKNKQHIELVKEAGVFWHRGAHATDDIQVVFTWMDREKWASWLKSVYGVKQGSDPAIVIVDHGRLLYYDSMTIGAPIPLDISSIFSALEGALNGDLKAKHSENVFERFARWLNGWMLGFQHAITYHPLKTVLFVALTIVGVFLGLKRLLQEDPRGTAMYANQKSGSRLD